MPVDLSSVFYCSIFHELVGCRLPVCLLCVCVRSALQCKIHNANVGALGIGIADTQLSSRALCFWRTCSRAFTGADHHSIGIQ